jgi:hypothetical protein
MLLLYFSWYFSIPTPMGAFFLLWSVLIKKVLLPILSPPLLATAPEYYVIPFTFFDIFS